MSLLLTMLVVVAAVYGAIVLAAWTFQPRLVFFPDTPGRALASTPADVGLAYEDVGIVTDDGVRLHAWYLAAANRRGVLLFCHGNAGNISHRLESLHIFNALRLDTLIFDYRGYGQSGGEVTEAGTYRDVEAAWRYLRDDRGIAAGDIVVFGRSLGAAIAAHLASRHRPAGLILESGFVSVPDLAASLYPWLPARRLARIRYATGQYLQRVTCPVLVAHSIGDEIIPVAHGRRLYETAGEPRRFLELRGGHNDGFLASGESYLDGLEDFLELALGR